MCLCHMFCTTLIAVCCLEACLAQCILTICPLSRLSSSGSLIHCSQAAVKNGEDISGRIEACMVDKLNNACMPPSNILTFPPQLTVLAHSARPGTSSAAAGFLSSNTHDRRQTYSGKWEQMPHGALRASDLMLVGPPGPVHLSISGGSSGDALKQGVLLLDLRLGPIARWQINGWPSGEVLRLVV